MPIKTLSTKSPLQPLEICNTYSETPCRYAFIIDCLGGLFCQRSYMLYKVQLHTASNISTFSDFVKMSQSCEGKRSENKKMQRNVFHYSGADRTATVKKGYVSAVQVEINYFT